MGISKHPLYYCKLSWLRHNPYMEIEDETERESKIEKKNRQLSIKAADWAI